MTQNAYALFRARFPADRRAVALTDERGRDISYGELETSVARMAGALEEAGLRPGDRLSAQVEKSPAWRAGTSSTRSTPPIGKASCGIFFQTPSRRWRWSAPK